MSLGSARITVGNTDGAGLCCMPSGACTPLAPACCHAAQGVIVQSDLVCEGDGDQDGVDGACGDGCLDDPDKIEPGECGCGVPDDDTDGDEVANCIDGCSNDPSKSDPGECGCGVPDDDTDGDQVADCLDGCPDDGNKTEPGVCGCGVSDNDTDGDTVADCNDNCPDRPNTDQADRDRDGVGNACEAGIPAVSAWGTAIMALLLLVGGRVYFNRRRAQTRNAT